MITIVGLPRSGALPQGPAKAQDRPAPVPEEAALDIADPGALARGVLVGLAISVPLWLTVVWLAWTTAMR